MLGIAAQYADGWSSWGGYGVETEADFYAVTASRSRRFTDMVGRFREIGIDEFVLCWPQTWREQPSEQAVFEEVTHAVMPRAARNPLISTRSRFPGQDSSRDAQRIDRSAGVVCCAGGGG
jgi:hypothetical protein